MSREEMGNFLFPCPALLSPPSSTSSFAISSSWLSYVWYHGLVLALKKTCLDMERAARERERPSLIPAGQDFSSQWDVSDVTFVKESTELVLEEELAIQRSFHFAFQMFRTLIMLNLLLLLKHLLNNFLLEGHVHQ